MHKLFIICVFVICLCACTVKHTKQSSFELSLVKAITIDTTIFKVKPYFRTLVPILVKVYTDDQKYRQNNLYKSNSNLQTVLDLKNQRIIDSIIKIHNYLNIKSIGSVCNSAINFVIIHGGLSYKRKYINLFDSLLKKRQLSPSIYAILYDKICIDEKKLQIYGTQVISVNNDFNIYQVNFDSVDINRNKIGMSESYREYLKIHFNKNLDSLKLIMRHNR